MTHRWSIISRKANIFHFKNDDIHVSPTVYPPCQAWSFTTVWHPALVDLPAEILPFYDVLALLSTSLLSREQIAWEGLLRDPSWLQQLHRTVCMPYEFNKFGRNFQTFHRYHAVLHFSSMELLQRTQDGDKSETRWWRPHSLASCLYSTSSKTKFKQLVNG